MLLITLPCLPSSRCSPNWNNYDDDYLRFVKAGGLSLAAGNGQQVSAGNVITPLNPTAPGVQIFLPAFISDVELYTIATGAGPVAVGIGAPGANPLEPPEPRTGLPNTVPGTNTPLAVGRTAASPTRSIIDGWLNGPTGWAAHLNDLTAAYLKMSKMGECARCPAPLRALSLPAVRRAHFPAQHPRPIALTHSRRHALHVVRSAAPMRSAPN